MTGKVLLAGDVDAIKEYVFETSSLPQIRGGSELLQECEEEIRKGLRERHGYDVIYCGGGSFLLEVPADRAAQVAQDIHRLYLKHTFATTVTVVHAAPPPITAPSSAPTDGWAGRVKRAAQGLPPNNRFAHQVFLLSALMQEEKNGKKRAPFYEALPFGRRCDRCGKRMASAPDPTEPEKALCLVCHRRDEKGRVKGGEIRGQFNRKFCEFWQREPDRPSLTKQPQDLDQLVKSAKRGYLAFLYADGNEIGHLLYMAKNRDEHRAISTALAEGTREALFEALAKVCARALAEEDYWPFDIVNVGGDDVTILVQAGYAWEIGVEFLRRFETIVTTRIQKELGGWPEGWPEKVTASCGIAIADVKYPIRHLERLAEDLLKEAKRIAKADPTSPQSAITFLWLPNAVASESVAPLMAYYKRHSGKGPKEWLTARPFKLGQAEQMLNVVKDVSKWPRSLRHRWGDALERGVFVSANTIFYDIARRRKEKGDAWLQTLKATGNLIRGPATSEEMPAPIWYWASVGGEDCWCTALLDVLELAELQAMRPDVREEEE